MRRGNALLRPDGERTGRRAAWLLLLLLTVAPAGASHSDQRFFEAFIEDGIAEVDAANLALQKSSNVMVKEFAAMMIKDHTSANDRLKVLAASKRTRSPSTAGADERAVQAKLALLSGRIFDRFYIRAQIYAHEQMLDRVNEEATSGKEAKAKAFAQEILPMIQAHLKMIRVLAASEGV